MKTSFASLLLLVTGVALAADADAIFIRDYAETRGFMLGRPAKARPTPDGKQVLFLRSGPRSAKNSLFEFDVATGKTRELLTPEQLLKGAEEKLTPEEKARRERMRITAGGFADYQLNDDGSLILLQLSGRLYVATRANGQVRELKTGPGTIVDPRFSPDGKRVGYAKDHDVFVYDLAADKEAPVTKGGTEKKSHGLAEFVAQEEMDRHSGWWWSPDSKFIAYEEADHDGVEVWHVADPANPGTLPQPFFYPRPGKQNVKVRVGIVPVAGGEAVWIDWDAKKYEYLAQVRWDPAGPLTIQVQNRLQNELALLKVDPATGKTTELLVEKDPAWVNIRQDVPRWLADGKEFLWISEGKEAILQRRAATGKFEKALVTDASLGDLLAVDEKNGYVYQFLERGLPISNGIVEANLVPVGNGLRGFPFDEGKPAQVSAFFGKGHANWIVTRTTPGTMPESTVRTRSAVVGTLPSVADAPPIVPRVEFVEVPPAGREEKLQAALVRPRNFDAKRKYPVIVSVYGGPGHLQVSPAMRNWLLPQWLADQGFIVVSIDNRGTPSRGKDFERALYKKFGTVPLDDQVEGLQALGRRYPELDLDRVGIYGWSFGGYMSALAVLKRPDVFKAAVAGAPVADWEDYDTHYTERYLGLPKDNPDAYKEANLLTHAKELKRPLLIIHGTADDNVYFRHSLRLADALFKNGQEFELIPLAGLTHMVPQPAMMEKLYLRIAGHFKKHLGER